MKLHVTLDPPYDTEVELEPGSLVEFERADGRRYQVVVDERLAGLDIDERKLLHLTLSLPHGEESEQINLARDSWIEFVAVDGQRRRFCVDGKLVGLELEGAS